MPPAEAASLLAGIASLPDLSSRIEALTRTFLGRPYVVGPLIGGPNDPEILVDRLDGFDCVTLVESVLALARAHTPADFDRELVALRYHDGRVSWLDRNHYMSLWLERNAERVSVVLHPENTPITRTLSCLAGYPPVTRRVPCFPIQKAPLLESRARTGDIVLFVSARPELDTFHVGWLVQGPPLRVRHASRKRGAVVEETLHDFLARNELPGLIVARPTSGAIA